jgi:hypothetical protein
MTKPKHRASWIYLPDRKTMINMNTIVEVQPQRPGVPDDYTLLFCSNGEVIKLQGNDAQAVIDFLIL